MYGCSAPHMLGSAAGLMRCVLWQRRQSLGLPEGDTDPFFHLHKGAFWEVRSAATLVLLTEHAKPVCVLQRVVHCLIGIPIAAKQPSFS